jgi:hypothetical protein
MFSDSGQGGGQDSSKIELSITIFVIIGYK